MNKKIRVLHYGLSNNRGGIEKVVLSWLNNKPKNINFDFAFEGDEKVMYQSELNNANSKCNVYSITNRYSNPIKYYNDLYNLIVNNNYDYVHYHVMTMNDPIPAIIANKINGCQIIFHCHSMYEGHSFPFKEKILQVICKILLLNKDYFKLACSNDSGRFMFKNDYQVIENGIDTSLYKYSLTMRNRIRKQLGIEKSKKVIGHIGHSCFEKNYPFIISTFSKLSKNNDDYVLLLIGNMNKDKEIINMVKEYGIENKTIFTGLVENAKDYYSAMDLFYLPSINEGFPVVLVEAQVNGLPCIVSEAITKDAKLSDNVIFIDLNEDKAINTIKEQINKKHKRTITIDKRYDEKNSSAKVFKFYYDNLL